MPGPVVCLNAANNQLLECWERSLRCASETFEIVGQQFILLDLQIEDESGRD